MCASSHGALGYMALDMSRQKDPPQTEVFRFALRAWKLLLLVTAATAPLDGS